MSEKLYEKISLKTTYYTEAYRNNTYAFYIFDTFKQPSNSPLLYKDTIEKEDKDSEDEDGSYKDDSEDEDDKKKLKDAVATAIHDFEEEKPVKYLQDLGELMMLGVQTPYRCVDIRQFWQIPATEILQPTKQGICLDFNEYRQFVNLVHYLYVQKILKPLMQSNFFIYFISVTFIKHNFFKKHNFFYFILILYYFI